MDKNNKNNNDSNNSITKSIIISCVIITFGILMTAFKPPSIVFHDVAYGEIWFQNNSNQLMVTVDVLLPNFVNVTNGGLFMGEKKNILFTANNSTFVINISGMYMIQYAASVSSGSNKEVIMAIMINGTPQFNTQSQRKISGGGDVGSQSGTGLLNLTLGSEVSLGVSHLTGAAIMVDYATMNMNIVLIESG